MRSGKRLALLVMPLMAAAAPAQVGERVVERAPDAGPVLRGPGPLRHAMLGGHNAARAAVGVPPLVWDERLATSARAWASQLARSGMFRHADQPAGGPARQGENLWTGTRGAYDYAEMVGHWTAERRDFVDAPAPGFSRTGRWQDVAHYSQMVWRGTTAVGCATATGRRDDVLVCRYYPAGNVVGQRAY